MCSVYLWTSGIADASNDTYKIEDEADKIPIASKMLSKHTFLRPMAKLRHVLHKACNASILHGCADLQYCKRHWRSTFGIYAQG